MQKNITDKTEENYRILKKRKIIKKIIFLALIFILILALIGFLSGLFKKYYKENKVFEYSTKNVYQYYTGIRKDYDFDVVVKRRDNTNTMSFKDKTIEIGYLPLYSLDNINEVFLPDTMQIVIPRIKNKSYKLNYFSTLYFDTEDDSESVYIANNNSKYLESSFLYNGEDFYFFPYRTKIIIDEKEYNLTPMSYIIVNYRAQIELYNKGEDDYVIIESHENDVIAYLDDYRINLSTDMIIYDNENRLLLKKYNLLPTY